ncbi:MAG TPA: hypothetical protein ACFYD3_10755 [Candidatus Hypogeohydataceae bacterium YC41]
MKDWVAPVIDRSEIRPKHFGRWGELPYPDFAHANEDISYLLRVRNLELRIIYEEKGVTISCPELELAMCGADEPEAWENFMGAYIDLLAFLHDHEEELSEELKRKLETIRQPVSFTATKGK